MEPKTSEDSSAEQSTAVVLVAPYFWKAHMSFWRAGCHPARYLTDNTVAKKDFRGRALHSSKILLEDRLWFLRNHWKGAIANLFRKRKQCSLNGSISEPFSMKRFAPVTSLKCIHSHAILEQSVASPSI